MKENNLYHIYIQLNGENECFEAIAILKESGGYWKIVNIIKNTKNWNENEIIWNIEYFDTDEKSWYKLIGEPEDYPEYLI